MTGSFNTGYYQNLMGYQQVGNMFGGNFSAPNTSLPGFSINPAQTATNPWGNIAWGDFSSANTDFTNLAGPTINPAETAVTNPNVANIPTNFNLAQSPVNAFTGLDFSNMAGPAPGTPSVESLMKDPYKHLPQQTQLLVGYLQTCMQNACGGLKEQVASIVNDPANYGNSAANGSTGGSTGTTSVSGNVTEKDKEAAIQFFMSEEGGKWTRAQAAGIVANLVHESGLQPHGPKGDGGTAAGVAQWRGDRQTRFKTVFGKDLSQSTLKEQLAYVNWELQNTHKNAGNQLRNATSASAAAGIVCRYYEIPADIPGQSAKRGTLAEQLA